jgi:hypothetical protein
LLLEFLLTMRRASHTRHTCTQIDDDYFAQLDAQAAAQKKANLLKHAHKVGSKLAVVHREKKASADKHRAHAKAVHAGMLAARKDSLFVCAKLCFYLEEIFLDY